MIARIEIPNSVVGGSGTRRGRSLKQGWTAFVMATYEDRLASFEPRKIKFTKKSALNVHLARGWPHPSTATPSSAAYRATPSSLAHAGFYFDPTAEKDDNVTCFMCEHSLGEWTENDDPFVEHLNVDPKCPWALARCSIELDRQRDGRYILAPA
jgi:Inhibitor of Apoptosis domain